MFQWYDAVFQTIDMRSFTSIWFWIVAVVVWTGIGHRVLGVPIDMAMRAYRAEPDDPASRDMMDLVRINGARQVARFHETGAASVAGWSFLLAVVIGLAVAGLELAQALALLLLPLTVVGALQLRLAFRLRNIEPARDVAKALIWHRMSVQTIALIAFFATAIWGVLRNFAFVN